VRDFAGFGLSSEGPLNDDLILQAKELAHQTRFEARERGIEQYRKFRNLDDGGYMHSVLVGEVLRVHVVRGLPSPPGVSVSVEQIPDFGSGWITNGLITSSTVNNVVSSVIQEYTPTPLTTKRLKISSGRQKSARFAVLPDRILRQDLNAPNPRLQYSQYVRLRPSMYSGLMTKVVQAIMGYGRVTSPTAFKLASIAQGFVPPKGEKPTDTEIQAFSTGVTVKYDNRFYRTHGVVKGADNKLWLCEIGTRGVLLQLLTYFKNTDTAKFKKLFEDGKLSYDTEALQILEELGGLPNGETFPSGDNLAAAKRAGLVVEAATPAAVMPFYSLQTFSSAIGWAFNMKGTEAHNVGYGTNELGLYYSEHWQAQLTLGTLIAPTPRQVSLASELRAALLGTTAGLSAQRLRYIWSKTPYISEFELIKFVRSAASDANRVLKQLDEYQVTRVTSAVATFTKVQSAVFYHPAKKNRPPIKFYEPLVSGLVTPDMRREGFQNYNGVPEVLDAPMYVYFLGDNIKMVRYYWDRKVTVVSSIESDFEECMYVGSWSQVERSGAQSSLAGFYTPDHDYRRAYAAVEKTTRVTGTPAGNNGQTVQDDPSQPNRADISRTWWFLVNSVITQEENKVSRTAVIVPEGARSGILFAHAEITNAGFISNATEVKGLGDPWSYSAWRDFGGYYMPEEVRKACGRSKQRTVWETRYVPGACTDLVDQGSWKSKCNRLGEGSGGGPKPIPGTYTILKDVGHLDVYADYPPQGGPAERLVSQDAEGVDGYFPWDIWFADSPGEFGDYQQCFATWNCLGDGDAFIAQKGPNGRDGTLVRGKPYDSKFLTSYPTFIGVVNGDGPV
jgi:hypothetical protein